MSNEINASIQQANEAIGRALRHDSVLEAQVAQAEATIAVAEAIKHLAGVIAASRSSVPEPFGGSQGPAR